MGIGEAHLNSVSQITACATLIPHSRMVEKWSIVGIVILLIWASFHVRMANKKDWPCHSGQKHSQLSITQFLFAVQYSVERGSDMGSGFESFIYSILAVLPWTSVLSPVCRRQWKYVSRYVLGELLESQELSCVFYKHILSVQQCSLFGYTYVIVILISAWHQILLPLKI